LSRYYQRTELDQRPSIGEAYETYRSVRQQLGAFPICDEQPVGLAAAIASRDDVAPRALDGAALRALLARDGVEL
jgi:hypothetical protein